MIIKDRPLASTVTSLIGLIIFLQPAEFCSTNFSAAKGKDYNQDIQFMKGTTTLAFKVNFSLTAFPQRTAGFVLVVLTPHLS